ncbi:MAG: hypothetical protein PHZ00_05950 [Candidatus Peribacteraceae bacterium]|nr:hypothetical protein [Candidatus Peribacteraceae bacterium]
MDRIELLLELVPFVRERLQLIRHLLPYPQRLRLLQAAKDIHDLRLDSTVLLLQSAPLADLRTAAPLVFFQKVTPQFLHVLRLDMCILEHRRELICQYLLLQPDAAACRCVLAVVVDVLTALRLVWR